MWFGWKCPNCWDCVTRLSSLQKGEEYYWQTVRRKQSVWIVRLRPVTLYHQVGHFVSAQAHFVECCSPRGKGGESFYVMVRWVACLVCVLSLRMLYMYCRAPGFIDEPWTSFLGIRKTAYTYCTLVTYTNRACSFHANKAADSLLGKAVLCAVSVVKTDRVQGGAATNRVQR